MEEVGGGTVAARGTTLTGMVAVLAVTIATLSAAMFVLTLLASPADAIVASVDGQRYGLTPIRGANPTSVPGIDRALGSPGIPGASAPRNLDGLPKGGGPLLEHGGPVMHSATTHVIYWDRSKEFTATTTGIVNGFFADVAHDSGLASNVFGVAGQYRDATGNAAYSSSAGGGLSDTSAYPASGCIVPKTTRSDPGPYSSCLFDEQLQEELSTFISKEKLPVGPTQLYFVLLPHKVATCLEEEAGGELVCSNNFFCAYHSVINPGPSEIVYADIPFSLLDSGRVKGCQDDGNEGLLQHPNGDTAGSDATTRFADVALKYISHEFIEAVTDPQLNSWFDGLGLEIGDKCNGVHGNGSGVGYDAKSFLPLLGGNALEGTLFNQSIGSNSYYLQSEWDNAAKACQMQPLPVSAAGFTSQGPALVGSPVGFSGSGSDPYSALGFSWSFGDGATGSGSSPTHAYAAPGSYSVTMTPKDRLTNSTATPISHVVVVNDLPSAAFTSSPNPATVGESVVLDGASSNDPDGSIVSYAWSFGDGGSGTGATPSHTYGSAGVYTVALAVTDSAGLTSASATHSVSVQPLPASVQAGGIATPATSVTTGGQGVASFQAVQASPLVPNAQLASTALTANASGAVTIKVTCPAGESSCNGTVTLRTLTAVSAGVAGTTRRKAILTLGSASFAVAGGKATTLTLHLSPKARSLLARSHTLRAAATVVAHDAAGASHTSKQTVTLRSAAGKRGGH